MKKIKNYSQLRKGVEKLENRLPPYLCFRGVTVSIDGTLCIMPPHDDNCFVLTPEEAIRLAASIMAFYNECAAELGGLCSGN